MTVPDRAPTVLGTPHAGLVRVRALLCQAVEELDGLEQLEPIERIAVLEARADVGEALRRVAALLLFVRRSER